MTLNEFIDEQLKDPEFKREWEASEKEFQETLATLEAEDRIEISNSYRSRRERNAVGAL